MATKKDNGHSNSKAVIAQKLGAILATTYMLRLKTQNFHWNVTGPNFGPLHEMFEGQYNELAPAIDDIAERIRALDEVSPGSFAAFSKLSKLDEAPETPPKDRDMIAILAKDNATLSKLCGDVGAFADDASDTATGDLMNGRILAHDKAAWMLKSHLSS